MLLNCLPAPSCWPNVVSAATPLAGTSSAALSRPYYPGLAPPRSSAPAAAARSPRPRTRRRTTSSRRKSSRTSAAPAAPFDLGTAAASAAVGGAGSQSQSRCRSASRGPPKRERRTDPISLVQLIANELYRNRTCMQLNPLSLCLIVITALLV